MRKITWLESAVDDVARLRAFIAKNNPSAAKNAALAIKSAVKQLMQNPSIGKQVTDLSPYRDLLTRFGAGGYVIRYRLHDNTIYIVHVRHYRENDFKLSCGK